MHGLLSVGTRTASAASVASQGAARRAAASASSAVRVRTLSTGPCTRSGQGDDEGGAPWTQVQVEYAGNKTQQVQGAGGWTDESPAGGTTELWVYRPQSKTVWPDPDLGVVSTADPRFALPGRVGASEHSREKEGGGMGAKTDVDMVTYNLERQVTFKVIKKFLN